MSLLFLLSPAKSLDFESPLNFRQATEPQFLDRAAELVRITSKLSPMQLRELMSISEDLAQLNHARFRAWDKAHDVSLGARPCVLAFDGDVYAGLQAKGLDKRAMNYLEKHLRILSGLYGVLRPFDAMRPYRLEMGTKLKTSYGKNLYDFWGDTVTQSLNQYLNDAKFKMIVNLASEEYFGVVKPKLLEVPVITPVFEDFSAGRFKIVSFFAKKARGTMMRYCAENKIKRAGDLKGFNLDGYAFCETASGANRWVFRRSVVDAKA